MERGTSGETPAAPVVGRERELGVLEGLLGAVGERGGALVVRGEAGIGKSALLAEASASAARRGLVVLATTGVQAEAQLPFAGLHHLLRPVLPGLERLPAPQRAAVEAAFGVVDGAAPDIFLIALAALDLIAELAAESPLLLVVEDAHWLDPPTCQVLAFVARRLELEPIVVLFAVREGFDSRFEELGLAELRLEGLDRAAAEALLDARAPGLGSDLRRRVLAEAAGNPLALVELPAALGERRLDAVAPPEPLPLTARLERAFAARTSELPPETRTVLLAAALDGGGDLAEILAAAALVAGRAVSVEAFDPAVSARLVATDADGVRFRHPLVRSAIYQSAAEQARRVMHAALAEVLAAQPDRRVWHRAAASVAPDEEVAVELDQAAGRARRRGGLDVAILALERAAGLAADPAGKARRLLSGAALSFELGRQDSVLRLVAAAEALELDPLERARLTLIQEMAGGSTKVGSATRVHSLLELAWRAHAEGDVDVALGLVWAAASRCYWTDLGRETRMSVVETAERMTDLDRDPRLVAILAFAAPIERGRIVVEHVAAAAARGSVTADGAIARSFGGAAHAVGAFELSGEVFAAGVPNLRTQGRLGLLARVLVLQSRSAIHFGRWDDALALADEGSRLAAETDEALFAAGGQAALAIVHALRGDEKAAERHAAAAERTSLPLGGSAVLAAVQWTRGLVALGAGRHDDAYGHLARMFDPADPAFHAMERSWAIGDLAEAAAYSGRDESARALLAEIEPLAVETPASRLHVALAYARPLLAGDRAVPALFQAALDADLGPWPFDRARVLLAYGSWLRRRRRVAESRTPLRAALAVFEALGAAPWAERARQELRASGETSRRGAYEAREHLTPQELQIAQLAADGLTNREIGQRLYLSHRTVGSHLYRVFPKLGITSRNQLRTALELD